MIENCGTKYTFQDIITNYSHKINQHFIYTIFKNGIKYSSVSQIKTFSRFIFQHFNSVLYTISIKYIETFYLLLTEMYLC